MRPSKMYFERNMPPNSFIHASDFGFDIEKLNNYLQKVATNIDLYKKYFEWKKVYKPFYLEDDVDGIRMCELCYRLNTERKVQYYNSVSKFFNHDCHF